MNKFVRCQGSDNRATDTTIMYILVTLGFYLCIAKKSNKVGNILWHFNVFFEMVLL